MVSPVGWGGFTFPHGAAEFTGLQMVIAATRVGLIFGLLGLWWSGALPMTRSAWFARYGAVAMMALLIVVEGLAVRVSRGPLDSTPPAYGVIYGAYTARRAAPAPGTRRCRATHDAVCLRFEDA